RIRPDKRLVLARPRQQPGDLVTGALDPIQGGVVAPAIFWPEPGPVETTDGPCHAVGSPRRAQPQRNARGGKRRGLDELSAIHGPIWRHPARLSKPRIILWHRNKMD